MLGRAAVNVITITWKDVSGAPRIAPADPSSVQQPGRALSFIARSAEAALASLRQAAEISQHPPDRAGVRVYPALPPPVWHVTLQRLSALWLSRWLALRMANQTALRWPVDVNPLGA